MLFSMKLCCCCTGDYITENEAVIYIPHASPCYDHGPVVHDWDCDNKQPVVVQIPSRIDHKYFFGPKKTKKTTLWLKTKSCKKKKKKKLTDLLLFF